jgi:hypothetical protein
MDLSVILAAAEHAEKSETPFFIAGSIWALFAVLISVFGFTRPDFPDNQGAARAVMAASIVFMLGATSMAVYVSS